MCKHGYSFSICVPIRFLCLSTLSEFITKILIGFHHVGAKCDMTKGTG